MSSSRIVDPELLIDDADISSNYTSARIEIGPFEAVSLHCIWTTSDVTGTISFEASLDGDNWDGLVDCDGTDIEIAVAGTSSNEIAHLRDVATLTFLRVVFTNTAGATGTLDVYRSAVRDV